MTPKEKAIDLYNQMKGFRVKNTHRKKCTRIAVNQILIALNAIEGQNESLYEEEKYWNLVKKEIEKL